MNKCDLCRYKFKPRYAGLTIHQAKDQLKACTSQAVWIVHNGRRFPVRSFRRVNFSWSLFSGATGEMTLRSMRNELDKRDNWDCLHNYSLSVRLDEEEKWAKVLRIEDTRPSLALEDDGEMEDSEGEVLIHVHTAKDAWEEYRDACTE